MDVHRFVIRYYSVNDWHEVVYLKIRICLSSSSKNLIGFIFSSKNIDQDSSHKRQARGKKATEQMDVV